MPTSHKIEFSVDQEDYPAIAEYARRKGHRTPSTLARYAVYALMARNPVGRHDGRGADRTEATPANPEEGRDG